MRCPQLPACPATWIHALLAARAPHPQAPAAPRAIVGLFTNYGLRDMARQQGLLALGAMLMPCWPRLDLSGFRTAAMVAQYIVFTIFASERRSG